MIKIFNDQQTAQDLCDKIQNFLSENCPSYSASCWQIPTPNDKNNKWFVEIPPEFEITFYDDNTKVKDLCKKETDKAIETCDKPTSDWYGKQK